MYTVYGGTIILRLKLNIYYKIYNEPCVYDKIKLKNSAATTKVKASVSTLIQERGF